LLALFLNFNQVNSAETFFLRGQPTQNDCDENPDQNLHHSSANRKQTKNLTSRAADLRNLDQTSPKPQRALPETAGACGNPAQEATATAIV
jgi:hypothetical protein